MTAYKVYNPFEFFSDGAGNALEGGKIYIGTPGLDAETNPIAVYFDAAQTTPATQPIRTTAGYPSNGSSAVDVYTETRFSLTVRDANDALVYSDLEVESLNGEIQDRFLNYGDRNAINAAKLASQTDGTRGMLGGYVYRVDSTATDAASCTSDLSVDGLVPQGIVHVEHYGGGVDDTSIDNGAAANRAYVNHATLHSLEDGTYWTSTTVREASNGLARRLQGGNKYFTRWSVSDDWPAGMSELNGNDYTVTVVDTHNYTLDGVNSTAFGAYHDAGLSLKKGDGIAAEYKRIIAATNAATCQITCPNHGYTTGDTVRIEAMAGPPMFWFGNSNGHGNTRNEVSHIRFDCGEKAVAVRLQEGGTSIIHDTYAYQSKIAYDLPGTISTLVYNNDIHVCDYGVVCTSVQNASSAVAEDDYSRTESALTIKANVMKIKDNWIRGGKCAMIIAGGGGLISSNTWQSVGNDPTLSTAVFQRATESLTYGGGPDFTDNWFESGEFKAAVEIDNTRLMVIKKNQFFGSSARTYEWFILASDNCSGLKVKENSFLFRGLATPTEGRSQTGYIYAQGRHVTLQDNHYAQKGTYTDAELFVLDRSPTGCLNIMDNGQNNGTPSAFQIGGIEITQGNSTPTIQPNSQMTGTFTPRLTGIDIINTRLGSTVTLDNVTFTVGKRILNAASIPTSGDYQRGDVLIDRTPTAGQYVGWSCTTGGTAGSTAVFKEFGSIVA